MMEWLKSLFGGKKKEETNEVQTPEPEVQATENTEAESSNEEQAQ